MKSLSRALLAAKDNSLRLARRSLALALSATALVSTLLLTPAEAAQTYTWQNVLSGGGGGFVPGIIFNPTEQNLIYARTDIGGAYRWNQSTKKWIPLMDWIGTADWNLMGVVTLATDPVEPARLYIGAGTYTNVWSSQNGAILRSTDRGATFQRTDLPFKLGGNMPGRNIGERLAVDPHKNSILYLGAPSGNGLWKSTDFGVTWNKVTSFPNPGTYAQVPGDVYQGDITGIGWVVFDPNVGTAGTASPNIYVGVVDKPTSIYRSTDGGATWSAVVGQPLNFFPHHATIASNGVMYVSYSDTQGPYDGGKGDVWKYDTTSGTWTLISPIPSTSTSDYFGYGGLAVDKQHPNTLMVASMNSWWPDAIVFRSIDGGTTWTRIWDWASYPSRSFRYTQDVTSVPWLNLNAITIDPVPAVKIGWMIDGFAIDPFNSDRMMYGTGLTLYGTENLTAWDTGGKILITPMAMGIEETAVQDLVSPPSGAPLVTAEADIGGFKHDSLTTVPATVFPNPSYATSTSIDFAELSPNFMVRAGNSSKSSNPTLNRIVFSFDGGGNWFQANSEPGGVTGGGQVAANANATAVVWSPPGSVVSVSSSNGNSWTTSAGIPAGANIGSDRVNPAKFYGFSNGIFYVSTNTGVSFTASGATGLPTFARFKATAGHEGDIWLAASGLTGGLWHSTDSGTSFTKLTNVTEAFNIGLGKAAPGQSYPALFSVATIGGVRGIFRSDDVGATWIRINDDQHQFALATGAITGDPRVYGRVYLANNGRGTIFGELSGTATPDFALSAAPATVSVARGATATSTITVSSLNGFTGAVALSAAGLPAGVTASFGAVSAAGTSTLTLTASSTAAATTSPASVTVTGTSGTLTHTAALSVSVTVPPAPDFSLAASPTTVSVARGATATSTITVSPLNGFTGAVALSASGLPAGVTASFSAVSAAGTSTLTLTASSTATATTSPASVTVTGTSGTLTHTAALAVSVTVPQVADFSLSSSAASLSVSPGGSATATITVNPLNGFTGSVALSASGLPAGVTATFSPASTTGTSTLSLSASTTALASTGTITITGTSGTLSHTTSIGLTVTAPPDFSLAATPVNVTAALGSTGTTTVKVTKLNGFTGLLVVNYTVSGLPANVSSTFVPDVLNGTATFTFFVGGAAPLGVFPLTITGTAGSISHTVAVNLTVVNAPPADFSLGASPATLSIGQGGSASSVIGITPINLFTGAVALSASGLPAGVTASFTPVSTATNTSTLTLTATGTATVGTANVTITGTSGTLSHSTTIALTVTPATTGTGGVTITPVVGSSSPWFSEEDITIGNTAPVTALTLTITVQATPGVTFNGQYNTLGSQIVQTHSSTATAVTYQYTLGAGQTLSAGTGRKFAAQFGGNGTAHPTAGDTYTATYIVAGVSYTQTGHF